MQTPGERTDEAAVVEMVQEMGPSASLEDQTLILLARLMEGGREDDETCRDLDQLTRLLNEDYEVKNKNKDHKSICDVIDADCVDTLLCYLDMRQDEVVRGHAILTTSAYLKTAGDAGSKSMSAFFFDRVHRGTYDDYIVAFSVAAQTFPIVPDLTADLFLSEGFLASLGPLMGRKWKSRKVETACLEMLNAACMNARCRESIQKYCVSWLEEVIEQEPTEVVRSMNQDPNLHSEGGSISMRRHSELVQNLAAVILAKLRAVPTKLETNKDPGAHPRVEEAVSTMEELSELFTNMVMKDEAHSKQHSIEGLAYASLQAPIKESIAKDKDLLKRLVAILSDSKPRSAITYGVLSIFCNLTRFLPAMTEEQKKMSQLKAYADAAGKLAGPSPLDDNDHVIKRTKAVFDAGITPVLVTHSKYDSPASLALITSIMHSLAADKSLRGQLSQQGAIRLLLTASASLPDKEDAARRMAAQALARILISTNPALVFGGNQATVVQAAVIPLVSILSPDPAAEVRDLLPTFEALMALTNLASMEDPNLNRMIAGQSWAKVEEQLLSSNKFVVRASTELVCNLVQTPDGAEPYYEDTPKAKDRLNVLLALSDSEDKPTRSAAGGALAILLNYEAVVRNLLNREGSLRVLLNLCLEEDEDLRFRGVHCLYAMLKQDNADLANDVKNRLNAANAVETMKDTLTKSHRQELLNISFQIVKRLTGLQ